MPIGEVQRITVDRLKIEIHQDTTMAGKAAAQATARAIQELKQENERLAVIFATGASQLATLDALVARTDVPWTEIEGFHLDEYVGISENHPASFRLYLRERLTQRVPMRNFFEIQADAPDPAMICSLYAQRLQAAQPQLCLLGIGENGHLAFNDPAEANFEDPLDVKIVGLDSECRQQQVAEGWFSCIEEVPSQAITLTIPALMRVPRLIASVPGPRKAAVIRRTVEKAISTACPATILRHHPDVTVYLDRDSAAELKSSLRPAEAENLCSQPDRIRARS